MSRRAEEQVTAATIGDFGRQWNRYRTNDGYYGSVELLADICEPLLQLDELKGTVVAEIGSGTGRIVNMLLDAGVRHVTALEPSTAFEVLRANTAARAQQVACVNVRGEELPDGQFDYVFSIGVLHHIPDPAPVVQAAHRALRPGGRMLIWLYGREGNELYLAIARPLRAFTTRLPSAALAALCHVLNAALSLYIPLCRKLPLPLRDYAIHVLGNLSRDKRFLVIYDQLNPKWAKYYKREEGVELLRSAGFDGVAAYHRHGYSWTVIGTKTSEVGAAGA
jgi:SAM-dependent methyltransferase